ncbi:hypothetical protein [Novosphingobium sp. B1]|uniref:hypothetical protein n=1 Tax=Novosphingobium sp. B1 TaxID=1938756 RepID=UPI0009D88137|nr:hypothetical protein [Novosphingobium sp. B1]SMC48172.1 hypothetical protein SAMN06272759_103196 [Novosphingobium sp. B1]
MFSLTVSSRSALADWLAWTAEILGALAWPVAALVIALLFRRPLLALLGRLDQLSWGDKSARFAQQLDRLESEAGTGHVDFADSDALPAPALSGDHGRFLKLLDLSPGAAVLDSWARVEDELQILAHVHHVAASDVAEAGDALQRRGVLPSRTVGMIAEMRALRNAAAHDRAISVTDALRFRNLAKGVLNEIRLA